MRKYDWDYALYVWDYMQQILELFNAPIYMRKCVYKPVMGVGAVLRSDCPKAALGPFFSGCTAPPLRGQSSAAQASSASRRLGRAVEMNPPYVNDNII